MGFFDKLKGALSKTGSGINSVFAKFRKVDEEFFDELEECLVLADVGGETSMEILDELRERAKLENIKDSNEIKEALKDILKQHLSTEPPTYEYPLVLLMVGVNCVGKTTVIGKLAKLFKGQGKSVLIAAADTFRAAAVEQLLEWGKRSETSVIHNNEGCDPSAVVYDAISSAKARGCDI
ncbi:MAG: signal recognition particle receptor subunit alpha, partial [Clostridia bacterium]|nr:signal recognition particle receptor subunit alpha [Clostridia bacterium]